MTSATSAEVRPNSQWLPASSSGVTALLLMLALAAMGVGVTAQEKGQPIDALGDPLPLGAIRRFGSVRFTHQGQVSCTAFSPDGKWIASGGYDCSVRLWDAATGKEIGHFDCPGWVRAVLWSPKGNVVIYATDGDGIRIREAVTGKQLHHFEQQQGCSVVRLAISGDGKTLAAGEADFKGGLKHNIVRLWDIANGKQLQQFTIDRAFGLAFSPDGRILAMAGEKDIRLWDFTADKELPPLLGHQNLSLAVAFSSNGKMLASTGSLEAAVIFWDMTTGRESSRIPHLDSGSPSFAFSPDGKTLATASPGRLWDVATGKELHGPRKNYDPIEGISFSPDGKRILGSWQRNIRLLDADTGQAVSYFAGHRGGVTAAAFSPDGRLLATGSRDEAVILWNSSTGDQVRQLPADLGRVSTVAFSPDGKLLAAAGVTRSIQIWSVTTGEKFRRLAKYQDDVACVAFSPDGQTLASAETILSDYARPPGEAFPDCAVRLWDIGTSKEIRQLLAKAGRVGTLAYSPDGSILASAGYDSEMIHLWDPATGRELGKLQPKRDPTTPDGLHEGTTQVAFSPDGRTLASVSYYHNPSNIQFSLKYGPSEYKMVHLWEVATGEERLQVRASRNEITSVAFAADGRTLILGKTSGEVCLWHIPTAKEARLLAGHRDKRAFEGKANDTRSFDTTVGICAVALSADGKSFATASWDTTALLWDATSLLVRRQTPPVKLSPVARETLWADLASVDGARAFRAIWVMVQAGEDIVPFLNDQLKPVPKAGVGRIASLIEDLDDPKFAVREKAALELNTYGDAAVGGLRIALDSPMTLEKRQRIQGLLAKHGSPVPAPQLLRGLRVLEVLEQIGTPSAQGMLRALGEGSPDSRLTNEAYGALLRLRLG